jgi:uncharacterized membrane protein HdeD (DUF308 family)
LPFQVFNFAPPVLIVERNFKRLKLWKLLHKKETYKKGDISMTMSSTSDTNTNIQKPSNSDLWIGILLIVLGLGAVILPNVTTVVAETWIAVILASAGASKVFYAIKTRSEGFIWKLLLGVLYIATGIMLFVYPLTGVLSLTLLLGSFLLTEGAFELILAFQIRPRQNWGWVLADGIVTLLLGGLVWFEWPFDAPWLIGILVGVSVLSTGISRLMLSFNGPKTIATAPDASPTDADQMPANSQ